MTGLQQFFLAAGWGIWPTVLLGTFALALSARHAWSPRPGALPLIFGCGAATLFAGALSFVSGCIACFNAIASIEGQPNPSLEVLALAGTAEALGAVVVALGLCMLVALLTGVGSYRAQRVAT